MLHYTTKGEQQLAQDEERFGNLLREVDDISEDIDPYHILL